MNLGTRLPLRATLMAPLVAASLLTSCDEKKDAGMSGVTPDTRTASARPPGRKSGGGPADLGSHLERLRASGMDKASMSGFDAWIARLGSGELEELARSHAGDAANDQIAQLVFFRSVAALAEKDPQRALDLFGEKESQDLARYGFSDIALRIGKDRPDLLQSWLAKLDQTSPQAQQVFTFAFESLARTSPQTALSMINAGEAKSSDRFFMSIFSEYASTDYEAAVRAITEKVPADKRNVALAGLAQGLYRSNPGEALRVLDGISDPDFSASQFKRLMGQWLVRDNQAAVEFLSGSDSSRTLERLDPTILSALIDARPDSVNRLLADVVPTKSNEWIFQTSATRLLMKDPAAAGKFLESLPDGAAKTRIMDGAYAELAKKDPAQVLALAAADPSASVAASRAIGKTMGQQGIDKAIQYIGTMPAGYRSEALAAAFQQASTSREDAGAVIRLLNDRNSLQGDAAAPKVYQNAFRTLAAHDPAAAKAALADVAPESRVSAMKGLAQSLAKSDVAELGGWLNQLPRSPEWTEAGRVLVNEIRDFDPELAAKWEAALEESK